MTFNVPFIVIDESTGYELTTSAGLPGIPVLRQMPNPGELICNRELELYVNTASGDPTLETSTTVPTALTTTSTTVAKPKVTPTTAP